MIRTTATKIRTRMQKASWPKPTGHKIKIYNPKWSQKGGNKLIQKRQLKDLIAVFRSEYSPRNLNNRSDDVSVKIELGNNSNFNIPINNDHVSGLSDKPHLYLIYERDKEDNQGTNAEQNKEKDNERIYLQPNKIAKNGTWKLIAGFIPWKIRSRKIRLKHGDTYFLGKPWQCFSLFDWSVGETVKIEYYSPLPFPYNVYRFCQTWFKKGLIFVSSLIGLFLLWIVLSWSTVPGAESLPVFNGAPVVIFASDFKTPLKPLPTQRPANVADLAQFGEYLPNAVVASEDRRFYSHRGVDARGILRAVFSLVTLQSSQGASTIDQQTARILYPKWVGRNLERRFARTILAKPTTIWRKLRELPLAVKIDNNHSKEEVLLAYLNAAPLGREKYGFVEAADYYFKKPVSQLNLAEVATLVAMLPEPNNYIDEGLCSSQGQFYLERLSRRRRRVIDWMVREGYLENVGLARQAKLIPVTNLFDASVCRPSDSNPIVPRIYSSLIYQELFHLMQEEYRQGNLVVETTIDPRKQRQAQRSLESFVKSQGEPRGISQGALVSIEPASGEVVALVEAVEPQIERYLYKDPKDKKDVLTEDRKICEAVAGNRCIKLEYNFASREEHPPGSTFKVFAYTAAIEKGVSPNKIYDCKPVTWEGETFSATQWKDSYCESQSGSLDMLTAMGVSDNLTAMKVGKDAGLKRIIEMAKRMGISSKLEDKPRLVLGLNPVTLLDTTSAYGVLANRGYKKRPHVIRRIVDISSPECSYQNYQNNPQCFTLYAYDGDFVSGLKPDSRGNRRIVSEAVADKMTVLMQGTVADGVNGRPRGTASVIDIRNAAGKTGTSDKRKDLWFVGYVPNELVTGVWLGNPSFNREETNVTSTDAAQVWADYMRGIGYR